MRAGCWRGRRCGARTTVVVATDGEGSHPSSPTHSARRPRRGTPPRGLRRTGRARAQRPGGAARPARRRPGRARGHAASTRLRDLLGRLHPRRVDLGRRPAPGSRGVRPGGRPRSCASRSPGCASLAVPHLGVALGRSRIGADRRRVAAQVAAGRARPGREGRAPSTAYRSQTTALSERARRRADPVRARCSSTSPATTRCSCSARTPARHRTAPPRWPATSTSSTGQHRPWGLDERFYEQRKRAAILAALNRPVYERAFEPGCAIGALTGELAQRCEQVVAWDVAATAVEQRRAGGWPPCAHVRVDAGRIPDEWPDGTFDLVVLSEVGYYCPDLVGARRAHRLVPRPTTACWSPATGDALRRSTRTPPGRCTGRSRPAGA